MVLKGTSLKAEAKIDHMAKRTLFATAAIYDGAGTLCATAQGLVKFSDKNWVGGAGSPAIN